MSATSTKPHPRAYGPCRRGLAALMALAAIFAAAGSDAEATPPRPADLQVRGGEESWRPDNRFGLSWSEPAPQAPALVATRYRIRDPQSATIGEGVLTSRRDGVEGLEVRGGPGVYSAELWFEDAAGEQGPPATAKLRFDDARPASVDPEPVPAWIGRTAFPLRLRIGHPAGPPPLSGFRGYAVTIGTRSDEAPCRAADRCNETETTLQGGVGDDEVEVRSLPEGTSYLHAVAVSGSGMRSATVGGTALRVDTTDPATRLDGVPAGWTSRAVRLDANATDGGSGMAPGGYGPQPFTAIRVDDRTPTVQPGATASADVVGEGVHRIAYYARDAAGNVDDGSSVNGIADRAPRTASVWIDRTPPTLAFSNAQDPGDPDLVRARVADALSGADLSRGRIGVRRAGSGDPFEPLPAAPAAGGELRARWSSDAYPPGDYEFEATGYDAAGNVGTTARRRNGGPMVLSNPLKATTTLAAGFHRQGLKRIVPYGRGARLDGRLTVGARHPLSGAPVRIVERFAAGMRPATTTSTVRTAADGGVSIRATAGPSRTVTMEFEGSSSLARSAGAIELEVRSGVRLHASAAIAEVGGPPVVFSGRLLAQPGVSPEGRTVQLQFRLPGLPWSEFRTIQANRRGRFRYAYRFSDDDSRGARFQFRAYIPAQDDWPYEPGGSRPVIVMGR